MGVDRRAIAAEGLLVAVTHRLGGSGLVGSSEMTWKRCSKVVDIHDLNGIQAPRIECSP